MTADIYLIQNKEFNEQHNNNKV